MSDPGAYESGMALPRNISENDLERLLTGRAPAAGDSSLEEVAAFVRALNLAVPEATGDPDPALITRLADAAGASASAPAPGPGHARTRTRRSPAGLIARVGIAAAMVPVLFAGLAVAGVTLPGPASDAFDRLGLELPNQSDSAADGAGDQGATSSADDQKDSSGKGEAIRRSKRKAYGPSRSARQNPPGNAIRRGPNPTPGTYRGKPDSLPSAESNAGGNDGGNAIGHSKKSATGTE